MKFSVIVLMAFALFACSSPWAAREISQNELGSNWPFTVPDGVVSCYPDGAITFLANGRFYGMNGPAFRQDGVLPLERIRKRTGNPRIPMVQIGTVFNIGLELCSKLKHD